MSEKKLSEEILKCLNDYIAVEPREMCVGVLQKAYEKIKEYEELEKQGKILRLPCAVEDTVFRVHKATKLSPNRIYECRVVGIKREYNSTYIKLHANINEETYSIWIDDWFDKCQIGYEFFLTREQAEAVLKELEGKK